MKTARSISLVLVLLGISSQAFATPATDGSKLLHVSADNSRYFANAANVPVYLVGAYEWAALVDGAAPSVHADNLAFLQAKGMNSVRWFAGGESPEGDITPFIPTPLIYARTGTCCSGDGLGKFDLTLFSTGNLTTPNVNASAFFERARARLIDYREKGIYVMVDLWQAWFWESNVREPSVNFWTRHPFKSGNNINGINADANADGEGYELGLQSNAVWSYQQAMIRQWIDATKDIDNIIWNVCNECYNGSSNNAWQNDVIDYIHSYEASVGGYLHPVLMSSLQDYDNAPLLASNAEAVAIGGTGEDSSPSTMDGTKVSLLDADHTKPCDESNEWPWKAFMRGHAGIYSLYCNGANNPDTSEVEIIRRLEQTLSYSKKINLRTVAPNDNAGQCSTQYCLIGPDDVIGYLPSGGSITITQFAAGNWNVEWFRPSSGTVSVGSSLSSSGLGQSFTVSNPFGAESVFYAKRSGAVTPPPPPPPPPPLPDPMAVFTTTWVLNSESDMSRYVVHAAPGTSCSRTTLSIGGADHPRTSVQLAIPLNVPTQYAVCVTAIDRVGNESNASNVKLITLMPNMRPAQPSGVSVLVIP